MPWLGSLHSAKNASPAATQRITEKNRVNSLNRRSHAGSRAILSTRLGPNSRSRRRASSDDSPSGLLRRLRSASSTESWWIFIGCPNPEHNRLASTSSTRPVLIDRGRSAAANPCPVWSALRTQDGRQAKSENLHINGLKTVAMPFPVRRFRASQGRRRSRQRARRSPE